MRQIRGEREVGPSDIALAVEDRLGTFPGDQVLVVLAVRMKRIWLGPGPPADVTAGRGT
jgi:hypothetical protein